MNFLLIPARNDFPWYRFKITLSGVVYTLRFRYNLRMDRWILDIADPSNNPILIGLPVLLERDMTGQYVMAAIPPGTLFISDDTNKGSQPGRYAFGNTHTFFYADPVGA
jgi:hypothetical protein